MVMCSMTDHPISMIIPVMFAPQALHSGAKSEAIRALKPQNGSPPATEKLGLALDPGYGSQERCESS